MGLLLMATCNPSAGWAAEGVRSAPILPSGVDFGEVLLGELNCVACHSAAPAVASRLDSHRGPNLGNLGLTLTAQWLRNWLIDPSASKPGTSMPHLLHALPVAERAKVAEDLTHYLVSLRPEIATAGAASDPRRQATGEKLFHTIGCVACHAPEQRPGTLAPDRFEPIRADSVPLGDLARKYTVGDLAAFLQDPLKFRPSGRMPSLGLSADEALNIALYVLRAQANVAPGTTPAWVAGLEYEYFEGDFGGRADFTGHTPKTTGEVAQPSLDVRKRDSQFGLQFRGQIVAEKTGDYTFWTETDDASRIYVDGREVVNNDGNHAVVHKEGHIELKAGAHPFELRYTQDGGGMEFHVGWSGPGLAKQPIPNAAFRRAGSPLVPLGSAPFEVEPGHVVAGREWFSKLNCVACHTVGTPPGIPSRAGPNGPPLAELGRHGEAGCLAEHPPAKAPRYTLSPSQRQALQKTLRRVAELAQPLNPSAQSALTLTKLNCLACHERDELGGPERGGRSEWFSVVGEADLGEEGRLPPRLTGVGAKLRPEWLGKLLRESNKVRPYLATRMPSWSPHHADLLASALLAADRKANAFVEPAVTSLDAKTGWKLAGREGLNCIACHTFTTFGSTGIPALALNRMAERLQWDWFQRYLPEPSVLRPGTRMPSFWPDGKAVNRDLAGGETQAQVRGLWAWLQQGAQAEVPAGLIRGRQEIVVGTEPVIYRNFIDGGGPRAIGVGYPEHINLAFDAQDVRLALIWQGSFIDAARHSTDRGVGFEPPLGDHRIALPAGVSLAVLPSEDSAWPTGSGRAAGMKFLGYEFDTSRRPVFRYRHGGVTVDEAIVPRPGPLDQTFIRTLRTTGSVQGQLWLRAAKGTIKSLGDGRFEVGGPSGMVMKVNSGLARIIADELRIWVPVPGELTLELTW